MLFLLSPSKTQNFIKQAETMLSSPAYFLEYTRTINKHLKNLTSQDIEKLMNVSSSIAEHTKKNIEAFNKPINLRLAKPAISAYTGEVFKAFDLENYSDDDFMFTQDYLLILSGFYGALRPLDLIEPYRLEMQTVLAVEESKTLYQFWKKVLTNYINRREDEILINLASNEYFKVLDTKKLLAKVITPVFKERKDGKEKIVAIFAKQARGTFMNWVVHNRQKLEGLEDLKKFAEMDYVFQEDQSNESEFVFVREGK